MTVAGLDPAKRVRREMMGRALEAKRLPNGDLTETNEFFLTKAAIEELLEVADNTGRFAAAMERIATALELIARK
jgi:hypothetical protein